MKISKGELVRISNDKCFTEKQGGKLVQPLGSHKADSSGYLQSFRKSVSHEIIEWEAGLRPRFDCHPVRLYRDRIYTVLRARCAPKLYDEVRYGMMLVLDTVDGYEIYIDRDLMEAAVNES